MFDLSLQTLFERLGASPTVAEYAAEFGEVLIVALLAYVANFIVKRILLRVVMKLVRVTQTDWDDVLLRHRLFERMAHFAPAIVIYAAAPAALTSPELVTWARKGAEIYMLIVGLLVADAALNFVGEIYGRFPVSRRVPIRGWLQVIKLVLSLAALIIAVSLVIDQSPFLLLSGLGAMTAVLLLIFRDTILGLVAGIQLTAQDIVRPGDWIEMPKYGADGDVEEIALNVVKVRNFDKTVTTIPTYALISDSFRNWRGMQESGGRRIKRALNIDVNSIRFCTPEMLAEFRKMDRARPYVEERSREIEEHNRRAGIGPESPANGRRMTNIGVFRAYVEAYLRSHPKIHQEMTLLVRQLEPTAQGLPIEVYAFTNDQRWAAYESIQADVFDHLFAVLDLFELRPFQQPAGRDFVAALAPRSAN